MIKVLNAMIAIIGGVGGILILYWLLNQVVERMPDSWANRLRPYVFVGPALAVVGLFLVYPAVRTAVLSFANRDSTAWVGLSNFVELFGEPAFRETLINNLLWIVFVPAFAVVVGLAVAVLADRLRPGAERFTKSVIFLPMAISFVGASTIWSFVYTFRPEGRPQIGLLNAIITALGFDPIVWLQLSSFNINDFLLMNIMVWLQAGFAMVLLSAAIKGVPDDTIEAARIDGASEIQVFFRIVVPQIWPTVTVVFVTVLILVMKVFDIVYVTNGTRYGTNVIGVDFFVELFQFGNTGRASAIVVILVVAVIPVMVYQVRRFRAEEAGR